MKNLKKSVAFFLPTLETGGAERIVVNIVNNLDRKKYDVSLILAEAKGGFLDEIGEDVSVATFKINSDVKLFFKLIKYFRSENIDIFVSAFPRINVICILAKVLSGAKTKIIITEHSDFSLLPTVAKNSRRRFFARFFLPVLAKILYPMADKIVCVSKGIAEDLSKIVNCKEKFDIIYNPIISKNIYELAKAPIDISSFLIGEQYMLAVGRLALRKDYPTLLHALVFVIEKRPKQKLVILGDGSEEKKIVQLSKDLGLSENVIFMGNQKNPYNFMANAEIFVLSSISEGFPTVIVEAMACGVPIVSTNCKSGPNEIIEDKKNGLLVPVSDERSLANAILELLNNKKLREKFSIEGRKKAECFSIEESISEYEKLFDKMFPI